MAGILDEAIVLRRLDYSETSQILVVLTRVHGPLRLLAKGARRSTKTRFVPGIDLLERGQVVFYRGRSGESGLGTLAEWRQLDAYLGLRESLGRWYAAQYVAEITAALLQEADPHREVYDALCHFLEALCCSAAPAALVAAFQAGLLKAAGFWPDFEGCVMCTRPIPADRPAYYAVAQGGLVCHACLARAGRTRRVDAPTLSALRSGLFEAPVARRAVILMDETITHHIGRPTLLARWSASR